MKQIASTTILLLLVLIISATCYSQQANGPKPKLFAAFPNTIPCTATELAKVFPLSKGAAVTLSFGSSFSFAGAISSNEQPYSYLQSTVLKSPAFSNAIFHLSKRINTDNSITYVGRIYNEGFGDGFELKKDNQGNYQLVKFDTDKVQQTCDHH